MINLLFYTATSPLALPRMHAVAWALTAYTGGCCANQTIQHISRYVYIFSNYLLTVCISALLSTILILAVGRYASLFDPCARDLELRKPDVDVGTSIAFVY